MNSWSVTECPVVFFGCRIGHAMVAWLIRDHAVSNSWLSKIGLQFYFRHVFSLQYRLAINFASNTADIVNVDPFAVLLELKRQHVMIWVSNDTHVGTGYNGTMTAYNMNSNLCSFISIQCWGDWKYGTALSFLCVSQATTKQILGRIPFHVVT